MLQLFFAFLNGAKPQRRWQFLALLALIILSGLVELAALGSVALFITGLSAPASVMQSRYLLMLERMGGWSFLSDTRSFYLSIGGAAVALIVLKNLIAVFHTYYTARFDGALNVDYGCILLRGYLELPYEWTSGQNSSDLLTLLAWRLYAGSLMTHMMTLLGESIVSVLLFCSLFVLQPTATVVAVISLGVLGGGTFLLVKARMSSIALRIRELMLRVNRVSMQSVQGLKDVKLFNRATESITLFQREQTEFVKQLANQRVMERTTAWAMETVGFVGLILGSLVMLFYADTTVAGMMSTLSLLAVSAWRILPAMCRCVAVVGYVQGYTPFLVQIRTMVDRIAEHEQRQEGMPPRDLPTFSGAIRLEGVEFRYDGTDKLALDHVALTINRGDFIGIVGHSGAGKSTLADLLSGLLLPSSGVVRVDGQVLDEVAARSWREQVGFVPQSPYLFDGSIAENVAFTVDDTRIDYALAAHCCALAGLSEFLGAQPGGLSAAIGERGSQLSGGQAQRVVIARALYKKPTVLIFDEATSALDDKTEALVRDTITSLRGNMTIILIAHRLKTVESCTSIVWLEHGKIMGIGAPADMLPSYCAFEEATVAKGKGETP